MLGNISIFADNSNLQNWRIQNRTYRTEDVSTNNILYRYILYIYLILSILLPIIHLQSMISYIYVYTSHVPTHLILESATLTVYTAKKGIEFNLLIFLL